MSAITNGEIRGGIEFFKDRDAEQCARCGSSVARARCWQCGGEGSLQVLVDVQVYPQSFEGIFTGKPRLRLDRRRP